MADQGADVLTTDTGVTATPVVEKGSLATGGLDVLLATAFELDEATLDAEGEAILMKVELLEATFELDELAEVVSLVLAGTAVDFAEDGALIAATLVLATPVLVMGHITAGVYTGIGIVTP